MIERQLIPKNIAEAEEARKAKKAAKPAAARGEQPEAPKGWLGKKMAGWRQKWEQILEEAQKQQQIQRGEQSDRPSPGPNPRDRPEHPAPGRWGREEEEETLAAHCPVFWIVSLSPASGERAGVRGSTLAGTPASYPTQ